jgi:hypothetical protein
MNRVRVAATGGLTLAAAAVVTVGLLLGEDPVSQPTSRPAGQVEQVEPTTTPAPTTTVPPVEVPAQDAPAQDLPPAPAGGDTGVMTEPAPEDPPESAPGNPAGDYEQRPDPVPDRAPEEQLPPPPVEPAQEQPTEGQVQG